jgi:tyrosyl-tRNA synthetase
MTLPILVGTDGAQKMSKSLGNYVGIEEPPNEMFGKVMSIPDTAIVDYFTLLTSLAPDDVDTIREALVGGTLRPMDAKKRLAETITAVFHSTFAAQDAREYFESTIQRGETPDEMPEHAVSEATPLHQVLVAAGIAASGGEVRRLAGQGAITVNGEPVEEFTAPVSPGDEIRVGRHRFLRVVSSSG